MVDVRYNSITTGSIVKVLPGNKFLVYLDKFKIKIISRLSGKLMRGKYRAKIIIGSVVNVEFSAWGDKGVIVSVVVTTS